MYDYFYGAPLLAALPLFSSYVHTVSEVSHLVRIFFIAHVTSGTI